MTTEQLYKIYLKNPQICTDTRKITASCLFFALKGDNFDGNKFAQQALESGAAYAIIDDAEYALDDRFIVVQDVLETLQDLARQHRKQLNIPVIGITGSNGKTTTKELIRSVLSQQFNTFATEGNLNNHIGVPLSILSITNDCEIAIIEMGANHQREIAFLCSIAQPSHGMITNIGKAHLEGFGGIQGVRIGKGELYEFLYKSGGIVFLNNDDQTLSNMASERGLAHTVEYGTSDDNFVSARLKNSSPCLSIDWNLSGEPKHTAFSNLPGIYNLDNICAAICIGSYFNLSPDKINKGINLYKPLNNRSQLLETPNNIIICDYYNANPSSMIVALDNLDATDAKSKVLILGDMFELGEESANEHRLILIKALLTKADRRILVGEEFYNLKESKGAEFYKTTSQAYDALNLDPIKQSTILLKGSRGMKLESLLNLL